MSPGKLIKIRVPITEDLALWFQWPLFSLPVIVILAYAFRTTAGSASAPPPSQVSPVTGSRHRGTHSCAYSTGCQLRTLTGFPFHRSFLRTYFLWFNCQLYEHCILFSHLLLLLSIQRYSLMDIFVFHFVIPYICMYISIMAGISPLIAYRK